jgi:hypothetical protein
MTIAETQLGIASLREHLTGTVFLPGDPGWAAEIRHTGGALARSVDATGHATRFQARPFLRGRANHAIPPARSEGQWV